MGLVSSVSRRLMPFGLPLRTQFPPDHLLDSRPLETLTVEQLEARTHRLDKLENLYHKGHDLAWDGKKLLAQLVKKHGSVKLPQEKKEAIANVFTVILWGELAAWEVASFLAERIRDNSEAKMAATIQTFDEARHYYVMRDYLRLLEIELPPPNAFVKSMLVQLISTESALFKLIGMQLFVEHVAVHLFKAIAETRVEPVLSGLMPYFARDEARHVGLGKLYLPDVLSKISRREALELQAYQLWLMSFMQLSMELHRKDADVLGIDLQASLRRAMREQSRMLDEIASHPRVRGLVVLPERLRFLNRWLIENVWASGERAEQGVLTKPWMLGARGTAVRVAERAWGAIA